MVCLVSEDFASKSQLVLTFCSGELLEALESGVGIFLMCLLEVLSSLTPASITDGSFSHFLLWFFNLVLTQTI